MSAMSDYLENKFLDHFLGTASTSAPAAVYLSLHTANPADDASGAEVSTSGTGYVRKAIAFSAASSGSAANSGAVEFDVATGSWGTISHVAVFDASSGGNQIAYAALAAAKTITTDDVLRFPAGDVDITLN